MSGRRNWPWTEKQRETLRKIKLWRRESKKTFDSNFARGNRVTWTEIARRLNELGWLGPAGKWSAQAVARQAQKDDTSPPKKVRIKKIPKTRLHAHEYLTYEQIVKCEQVCPARDRLIFDFLVRTGLRSGEFAKLKMRDLQMHPTKPLLHVRRGKRGKERFIMLSRSFAERLDRHRGILAGSEPMFPDARCEQLSATALRKRLRKLGEAAGVGRLYPCRLRHTFGMALYDCAKDLVNVARQMGHSDINATLIYAETLETASLEQAEGLAACLSGEHGENED